MMEFKLNKQSLILMILTLVLGVSIFFIWFLLIDKVSVEEEKIERVIFKENGVDQNSLYTVSKANINESGVLLNKLKIFSDATSLLDGLSIDLNDKKNIPLAIVVENHTLSRPQMAGLEKAKIVYEVLVEGGITRFLAVYDPIGVEKIGPVRSARPYLIHWAEEFSGVFTHIGGSDEALSYLKNSSRILNVDENEGEEIIVRDNDYEAPHNAFTSTTELYKKALRWNWEKQITESFFKFKLKEYPVTDPIQKIALDFSLPNYKVVWEYNAESNDYERYVGGMRHGEIKAKNLIVQLLPNQVIEDDEKGRLNMSVLGQGKAFFYIDGEEVKGFWQKLDYDEKTIFYNGEHEEMQFNKGKTWIEVIDFEWKIKAI